MDKKFRTKLRSMAQTIDPIGQVGKGGISANQIESFKQALEKRELVKITVLENDINYKELLNELAAKLNAEPVCSIGKKLVLYRFSNKKKVNHVLDVK